MHKIYFLALAYFFSSSLYAATLPSCEPLALQGETIHLQAKKPMLVAFHNVSMHDVYASHHHPPLWTHRIAPDHWATLVLVDKKLVLSCVESVPGHEQAVPCAAVLSLCQRPLNTTSPAQTTWVVENSAKPAFALEE